MNIQSVAIDTVDGEQIELGAGTQLRAQDGSPLWLDQVADALSDATGWIEYGTAVHWSPAITQPPEPWQNSEPESEYLAHARIYARAVVQVMVIYDEVAEPADA